MTYLEQLDEWVKGNSVHLGDRSGGNCCPDFSCCCTEINTPVEERKLFRDMYINKKYDIYEGMLMKYLRQMINIKAPEKKVHIAGEQDIIEAANKN